MIKNSKEFYCNGHSSKEFGIVNANIETGDSFLEESFLGHRNILEEKNRWNCEPNFNGVEEECKKFSLSLAFKPEYCGGTQMMDKRALRNIALWLGQKNYYMPMWFIEDCEFNTKISKRDITRPKRIYFVILTDESFINHYGRNMGYLTLNFKTNSPYCFSKIKGGDTYVLKSDRDDNLDMSEEGANSFVFFFNYGDKPIKPQISLKNLIANQHIKLIGQPVPPEYGKQELKEFDYTYPVPQTDFSKFPIFEISEGKKAKGNFKLNDTVFDGETVTIGEKTYEFDLGDNQPKNKLDKNNILVPILGGKRASNTLRFKDGDITEASTVTIGDQVFEYDADGIVTPSNIKVDISDYVGYAKGILHLNSNLLPDQEMKIGDINYTMVGGTNEFIIKMTDHLLNDGQDYNLTVRTDRKTLTQDNLNINTKMPRNIKRCLVRNVSKNPYDLGIRKMKYLNKDFVMVLWDGENEEDFEDLYEKVNIDATFSITFPEPVDEKTINTDNILVTDADGLKIPILFNISTNDGGKIVDVIPQKQYEYDTEYFIYVSRAVKDKKGESFKTIRKIKFKTKTKEEAEKNGLSYSNVSVVKDFTLFSNKVIKQDTVNKDTVYVTDENGNKVNIEYRFINNGKALVVQPIISYKYGKKYEIHFTTKVLNNENTSVVPMEKIVTFTTHEQTSTDIDLDLTESFINCPTDKIFKFYYPKKLNQQHINRETIMMVDDKGKLISDYQFEIDNDNPYCLKVYPFTQWSDKATYYLYISNAVTYEDDYNIETNKKYKIVINNAEYNKSRKNQTIEEEIIDTSILRQSLKNVPVNKVFKVKFNALVDFSSINQDSLYVIDRLTGKKVPTYYELCGNGTDVKVFPEPLYDYEHSYELYANELIKSSSKPRAYAMDAPKNDLGKGDYENAKELLEPIGFEVIKSNNFKVENNKLLDQDGNEIKFFRHDLIIGGALVNVPKEINTGEATRIDGKDRVGTRKAIEKFAQEHKYNHVNVLSLCNSKKMIVSFTTRRGNSNIDIDLATNILLNKDNRQLNLNEIPKKIKGMRPGDSILLYEDTNFNFVVDKNMLVPWKVPDGAKAYAGYAKTVVKGIKDDYLNAVEYLKPLGYEIVDTAGMTYEEKEKIVFKEGDLVIGGELAGSLYKDFDKNGNLKKTSPSEDKDGDTRKERVLGIPRGINIYPAKRLQGSANNPGRDGTLRAMKEWADLINQYRSGKLKIPKGYMDTIAPSGITVKYNVPKGTRVYGAGFDFYNGLRYLADFNYKFVNVGEMDIGEKRFLPFKKDDLVLGDIGASATILGKTVYGIPASVGIGEAIRLGGKDRYETEKKIAEYASTLKVNDIYAGDIVRLEIKVSDNKTEYKKENAIGDTPGMYETEKDNSLYTTTEKKNKNIVVEYHRVKSVQQFSRGRAYIEFEEDIRSCKYIRDIDITNVYRLYETRLAEDYLFTAPYQIKIGYDKKETMINIIKAINDTGTMGIEYSLRTFKHPIVLAQKLDENEIQLNAIKPGKQGNIPVSLIDRIDPLNRFLTPTLEGGKDCEQSDGIRALAEEIEKQNKLPERYNKDKYECSYTSNTLTIKHMLRGKKYNNILCLANVTKEEKHPYIIKDDSVHLINMQDFLTRQVSIAKWDNPTLVGGEDPDTSECIIPLKLKIEEHQKDEIDTQLNKFEDGTIDKTRLNFEYKEIGEIGNINFNTTCVNGVISGKKFTGGLDGLEEGEELFIDCKREEIISSTGKDRYKNFNGNWLQVPMDDLKWKIVDGECIVAFKYREEYYI